MPIHIYICTFLVFRPIFTMSNNYQTVLDDLTRPLTIEETEIPPPYNNELPFHEKFNITLRAINRASRLRDRILMLLNAYYMGKLLEDDEESIARRTYYSSKLSQYYRIVSVRLYYLYEYLGPRRIMNSTGTTLTNIRNLRSSEYLELVSMALNIFNGVENLEGE